MRGKTAQASLELAINALSLALQQCKGGNATESEKLAREGLTHTVDAVCNMQKERKTHTGT